MSGFVYIWYDRKHKRYYVGSHWGTTNDGYDCSSRWMRAAKKRRPDDFKRRVIKYVSTSKKDLLEEEGRWLGMIKKDEIGNRYYNLRNGNPNHWTADEEKAKEIRKKITAKTTGRKLSPESIAKRTESVLGSKRSEETKRKQSEARKGMIVSDETKQKLREINLGKTAWNKGITNPKGRKKYLITIPTGEKIEIVGLQQFCKENGLNDGRMSDVAKGKQTNHKGYICEYL